MLAWLELGRLLEKKLIFRFNDPIKVWSFSELDMIFGHSHLKSKLAYIVIVQSESVDFSNAVTREPHDLPYRP